ncbi:MAG: hypothetical protein KJ732_06560 [Candidatus Margulisbacteria bacterium]|nr:hypothetical protein [Candidatus Margulisiibacteriota bacterium]
MSFNIMTELSSIQISLLSIVILWSIIWKGFAMWKAARNNQSAWFVALLVINTVGILEIIYISYFQKKT